MACSKCGREGHYAPTCGRQNLEGAIPIPKSVQDSALLDNQGNVIREFPGRKKRKRWSAVTRVANVLERLRRKLSRAPDFKKKLEAYMAGWRVALLQRDMEEWTGYSWDEMEKARAYLDEWLNKHLPRYRASDYANKFYKGKGTA